jgi:hypothetical protein
MATALFITEQFIKDNTLIDGNVDMKYITTTIADAQRLHILPILGTGIYNELGTQINAGTLTALNTTLLDDYIQDALKFWVIYEGIDLFSYHITNKNISTKNSDNSQPVQQVDVIRLMDRNKEKAEWFSQRITKYLLANISSYPLYNNAGNSIDTIYPNRSNFTCGWNLDTDVNTYGLPIDKGRENYCK